MEHKSPEKPDPSEPNVWRDEAHAKQPEQRMVRREASAPNEEEDDPSQAPER